MTVFNRLTRVSAIQMTSVPNKSRNLERAEKLFREALKRKPRLVAFPEVFTYVTDSRTDAFKNAEPLTGPTVATLRNWAKKSKVWIAAGSLICRKVGAKKLNNTSVLINPQGGIKARYDKIHLFDATISKDRSYQESKTYQAGKRIVSVPTPLGQIGMSICYDLRFPELYRMLAKRQTEILLAPSAFTVPTGKAHWDVLTRSRAIENQCFLIAAAQTGTLYPDRKSYGHSRIVDPWGRVLAEKKGGTGPIWADLDFSVLNKVRKELPALKNRQL